MAQDYLESLKRRLLQSAACPGTGAPADRGTGMAQNFQPTRA